jgi:hypothetical protein
VLVTVTFDSLKERIKNAVGRVCGFMLHICGEKHSSAATCARSHK